MNDLENMKRDTNSIEKKGYHNDIIMDFFVELLIVIGKLREIYCETGELIYLSFFSEMYIVDLKDKEFSEIIVRLFLKYCIRQELDKLN